MIRVVVVSDVRLYREGLSQLLGRRDTIEVVASAATLEDALAGVSKAQPDIILLDAAMRDGVGTMRALRETAPSVKVVALSVAELEQDVLACAEAGVAAYVTREASIEDLLAALDRAVRGEALCSPRIVATLMRRLAALAVGNHGGDMSEPLTAREREILRFVDRGLSNKDIARELHIEAATVKNHVHSILEKLKVHRRGEAAARMRGGSHWRVTGQPG